MSQWITYYHQHLYLHISWNLLWSLLLFIMLHISSLFVFTLQLFSKLNWIFSLLVWLVEVTMHCYNVIPQSGKKPSVSMNQAQKYTGPWQGACGILWAPVPLYSGICLCFVWDMCFVQHYGQPITCFAWFSIYQRCQWSAVKQLKREQEQVAMVKKENARKQTKNNGPLCCLF